MMSQSEDKYSEEWRKAFEKASETPPPSVWDAIEKHLDERERTIPVIPWWQKPVTWYAAASVSALLLIGSLVLQQQRQSLTGPETVAVTSDRGKNAPQPPVEVTPEVPGSAPAAPGTPEAAPAAGAGIIASTPASSDGAGQAVARVERNIHKSRTAPGQTPGADTYAYAPVTKSAASAPPDKPNDATGAAASLADTPAARRFSTTGSGFALAKLPALDPLPERAYREKEIYMQRRYVFYNPEAHRGLEIAPDKPVVKKEEYWAGASFMPASFNPNMEFNPGPVYQMNNSMTAKTSNFSQSSQQPTATHSKAGLSYAFATHGGVKLSRHWSLETGLSYLQGNSTYNSNGFFLDLTSRSTADVLANALLAGSARYNDAATDPLMLDSESAASVPVYVARDKSLSNTYRYLQVPAYVGYTFYPDKKLNYTVLGGGVADFFLKNQLETASEYTLTTRPENKVYNNVNWSAATGLRINYRLSEQWNTSLTGSYQHSLMTTFRDNEFLKARPQLYGISWGVRYTF